MAGKVKGQLLTVVLRALLGALLILSVISVFFEQANFRVLSAIAVHNEPSKQDVAIAIQFITTQPLLKFGFLLLFVSLVALFVAWTYRMNANLHRHAIQGLRFKPGWAAWWYFIPVANLWKPYQVVSEVWRASKDPLNWRQHRADQLVLWWWIAWVVTCLIDICRSILVGLMRGWLMLLSRRPSTSRLGPFGESAPSSACSSSNGYIDCSVPTWRRRWCRLRVRMESPCAAMACYHLPSRRDGATAC